MILRRQFEVIWLCFFSRETCLGRPRKTMTDFMIVNVLAGNRTENLPTTYNITCVTALASRWM
jgi:hypothetical protein